MVNTVEETDAASNSPIQKFYRGQSIFITGGTGFVGMLLIEKLLRACYDLSMIYLLIRPKKGLDAEKRLDKIFEAGLYDRLKEEAPKFREKIKLIKGDCSLPELGLSAEDKAMLQREVSVVFHAAAPVNFDLNLRIATMTNVLSTKLIMEMCKDMPKLKAVIYVSTAFSNCIYSTVDEKIYEPPITYKNMINILESLSPDMLERVRKQLLGKFPNTYSFSKCIAEQVVQDYGKDLPAGVFRPAMITPTYKEPEIGWTNNVYGAIGVATGIGTGILRTFYVNLESKADIVPADYTINALIATAWDVANRKLTDMDPLVYNYASEWNTLLTWGRVRYLALKYFNLMPMRKMIWYPTFGGTKCWYYYIFLRTLLHLIPAYFIDGVLKIIGRKPMLLGIYKKIHKFSELLSFYCLFDVKFHQENVFTLWNTLNQQDQKLFFFSMYDFDWDDYLSVCIKWTRKYILHEDPSIIPQNRKRYQIIKVLHYTIKYVLLSLLVFYLFRLVQNL